MGARSRRTAGIDVGLRTHSTWMDMNLRFVVLPVMIAFHLVACGAPMGGDDCRSAGYLCQDRENALECRDGTWTELPCRGPNGCAKAGDGISCDTSAAIEGDACAASAEGRGLCAENGRALLECRRGAFVKTASCSSCAESAGRLVCNP